MSNFYIPRDLVEDIISRLSMKSLLRFKRVSNFYISHDLVEDILSKLPVKSILRFKCVSKSWYLIIESPEFIRTHAKLSEKIESNRKLIAGGLHYGVTNTFKLYALECNSPESLKAITNMEEIKAPSITYDMVYEISFAGSCNGLLCLVYSKQDPKIILWNPSIQEYRVLPICSKQYRNLKAIDTCVHGFGYDEVTDDYKVVRLIKYEDEHLLECLIYSLHSNEWRSLEIFPSYDPKFKWCVNGVLTNGALHWLLRDNSILAFNLGTEEFQLIPPPEGSKKFPITFTLAHDGCLSLLCNTFSMPELHEIWVMKDYGKEDSWTKYILDISTNLWNLLPFQLSKSHKYIFLYALYESGKKYVLYNFEEEQSCKEVKFSVELDQIQACVYFESLVKLNGTVDMNWASKTTEEEYDEINFRKLGTKLKKALQTIKGFTWNLK